MLDRSLVEDRVGRVVGLAVVAHEVDVCQEYLLGAVHTAIEPLLDLGEVHGVLDHVVVVRHILFPHGFQEGPRVLALFKVGERIS